jgi:hypothetical protein
MPTEVIEASRKKKECNPNCRKMEALCRHPVREKHFAFGRAKRKNDSSCRLPAAPSLRTRRMKPSSIPVWMASPGGFAGDVCNNLNCLWNFKYRNAYCA